MSQRPRSQGGRSSNVTTDANIKSSAEKAVYWILAHNTHLAPIKHTDLKKHVFPDTRVEEPLKMAKEMLNKAYGYDLVELPGRTKQYILVNRLGRQDHIKKNDIIESSHVLLAIVMGYIFMNRKPVEERQLVKFLDSMQIHVDRKHFYFGNVKDQIFNTFIKDQYLNKESDDEYGTFYSLGERFKKEVDPRALLKFVSKMCGEEVEVWKAQLKDIEEMEANME